MESSSLRCFKVYSKQTAVSARQHSWLCCRFVSRRDGEDVNSASFSIQAKFYFIPWTSAFESYTPARGVSLGLLAGHWPADTLYHNSNIQYYPTLTWRPFPNSCCLPKAIVKLLYHFLQPSTLNAVKVVFISPHLIYWLRISITSTEYFLNIPWSTGYIWS